VVTNSKVYIVLFLESFMENRDADYEVSATVDGKPVTVTRLTPLENFRSLPLAERMEGIISGKFDNFEVYLASNGPNSQVIKMRYRGTI